MKKLILIVMLAIAQPAVAQDELVLVSPHWEGYKREFQWGFEKWYEARHQKKISVRWFDLGGASDILKYISSKASRKESSGIDVFFGGGVDPFLELKESHLLSRVELSPQSLVTIPQSIQGNPVYDSDGFWYSVNLAGFGILYNRRLLSKLGVSDFREWDELGDSRLQGWIGSADPRKSGSVRFIYELLLEAYGWEKGWQTIYNIASNVRVFSSNSSQTPKDISLGEIAAGMMVDSYARDVVKALGDESVGMVIPSKIPSVFGDGIAVLSDAAHPLQAKEFIEFCLSTIGQNLLIKKVGTLDGPRQYELGRLPIRPEIYDPTDIQKLPMENPFLKTAAFALTTRGDAKRFKYVTALLGGIAVDMQEELANLRYRRGVTLNSLPPPVSAQELAIFVSEAKNVSEVVEVARGNLQKILGKRPLPFPRIVTVLLGIITIGTLVFRRALKTARRRSS